MFEHENHYAKNASNKNNKRFFYKNSKTIGRYATSFFLQNMFFLVANLFVKYVFSCSKFVCEFCDYNFFFLHFCFNGFSYFQLFPFYFWFY